MTGRVLAPTVLACLLALASAAPGQTPSREQMREAERAAAAARAEAAAAVRRGEAAEQEEQRFAEQRVAAARRAQQADAVYDAALERQRAADATAGAAEAEARRRAQAFAVMLPVLRRLALYPAETLLAIPAPPEEALRGALVLRSLARHLREEAESLRTAREAAAAATAVAADEAERAGLARGAAREAAAALDAQIAAARARQAEAADAGREAAERAQAAAARAADIQDVLARLEREAAEAAARAREEARRRTAERRPPSAPPPPPVVAEGPRAMPVAGRITRDFGDATDAGPARGVTIAAPPGARVVSPCTGRAVFAGPFRSYGQLVIVDCGEGNHVVLAGLERLDATAGARLLSGEPVGVLGSGASGRPSLYLELRRNGQAVDPRPWLGVRS
ncbi:MAG TPA: peptidoglycan DD-metalloendopeptidase family protein [Roseomonas sp.]